jgi:hypothetical protein
MSTQGVGNFAINAFWESGRLIYYEKAYGHTTTGDVFILGADYVQVGDTANDVNFVWKGDTTGTFTLDAGAHTLALTGMATSTDGAVTITNATATSSTTTGALIVTGGIATAADITCGDDLFMSNGGVINFNAGNLTLTHSAGTLTNSGILVNTGAVSIDDTTASTSTTTGSLHTDGGLGVAGAAFIGTGVNVATSGSPATHTAGTPNSAQYFTAAGAGSTSIEPFLVYSTLTGTSPVGGRGKFYTTANVVCGGWVNALKSHMNFGTSGRVTGLASSMCVEMDLPNANLGSGGSYYPLEVELNPGASTVSAGSATGNQVGFIAMSVNTNKADFDDNGFLFKIDGLTADTNHLLQASTTETNYAYSLRINVGGTPMYLMLASAAG